MRIVTWNASRKFREKFRIIEKYDADLFVIQECEDPERYDCSEYAEWASNFLWIGNTKDRGLGVFAKRGNQIESYPMQSVHMDFDNIVRPVKFFLPFLLNRSHKIISVWTHSNNSPTFGYIGQFWKFLQTNRSQMSESLVIGDFNSHTRWDKSDRWWNHSDVVSELNQLEIRSLYHKYFNEKEGSESRDTFYLQKNRAKNYHIDYAFGSPKWTESLSSVIIGDFGEWRAYSDHVPLIFDFNNTI